MHWIESIKQYRTSVTDVFSRRDYYTQISDKVIDRFTER
jgi:hypothetical protein